MFVAWRDLRFARGRFALIGSVVLLITLLVGFLGGLTQGLANANISALTPVQADRVALAAPAAGKTLNFTDSRITPSMAEAWDSAGFDQVEPLGIAMTRVSGAHDQEATASIFGVEPTFNGLSPDQKVPTQRGEIVLSTRIADALHAAVDDSLTISGQTFRVSAISQDAQFSHTGVVWVPITDWRSVVASQTAQQAPYATALLARGGDVDAGALDQKAGTSSSGLLLSLLNIESFKSEIGSLAMMLGMLLGISALVVGAFFTVWTIQRTKDIAVLKALGAATSSLVRDALGQALVILVVGVGVGMALVAAIGAIMPASVPFVVGPLTTLLPAIAMIVLGLLGAAFALRSVVRTDPLTALNSQNS